MTELTFRPTHVAVHFSAERQAVESAVWVLSGEAARQLSASLEHGEFPADLLAAQEMTTSTRRDRLVVTAQGYSMRGPCETWVMGLHRPHGARPLHLALVVVRFDDEPSYRVLKVLDAEWSQQYQIQVNPDGMEVLELITGYPEARINRSRDGDSVVWQVD